MATRSTVTIHTSRARAIHLYRHWDGGPWGNGLTLAKLLRRNSWGTTCEFTAEHLANRFATELIRTSETGGHGVYELTGHADQHGDTEWHYDIFFTHDGEKPAVRVKKRNWSSNGDHWMPEVGGDVALFRRYLADWMRGMLLRTRERKAKIAAAKAEQLRQIQGNVYG